MVLLKELRIRNIRNSYSSYIFKKLYLRSRLSMDFVKSVSFTFILCGCFANYLKTIVKCSLKGWE